MLTFDDGITNEVYPYYDRLLEDRTNPNGCPISSTFFVSHRFTNYRLVQVRLLLPPPCSPPLHINSSNPMLSMHTFDLASLI